MIKSDRYRNTNAAGFTLGMCNIIVILPCFARVSAIYNTGN